MSFLQIKQAKKLALKSLLFWGTIALFSGGALAAEPTTLSVKIKILSVSPARLQIEGKFETLNSSFKDWTFLKNYADVSDLAERIEKLQMFDGQGKAIAVKTLAPGEYLAGELPTAWRYEVTAGVPAKLTDSAHVSWLSPDRGLLMLDDLLPQFNGEHRQRAHMSFDLPPRWKISTSESLLNNLEYDVDDIGKAVFLVGNDWRDKNVPAGKTVLNLSLAGDWQFSDVEALDMANSILSEHTRVFGDIPKSRVQIIVLPFPQANADADRWRAETRGSTVVIISGSIPLKSVAIQRLHEQLRHEIFHLWIPNSLNLSGNYDWFYEGFTIYHALRTGVELNQIRFDDYLNTLGRAYDLADFTPDGTTPSLIRASQKRWSGSANYIYAKGLVVAFLCDLALVRESKGKRSLKDVFRQVYQRYRAPNEIKDGNTAISGILKSYPELLPIVQKYIEGESKVDWKSDLATAGIDFDGRKLKIMEKPNSRQRDLLDKLGYNQWRKLLEAGK